MKTSSLNRTINCAIAIGLAGACLSFSAYADQSQRGSRLTKPNLQIGLDLNNAGNPFVQPQDDAQAGGGLDQSLQFGDILRGINHDDLLIGRLGIDVLVGGYGDDVMVGGLEHFNPLNRDRAFGGHGNDIFIWKPGDGSDLFDGSHGHDVVVFGVAGELVDGTIEFAVVNDEQAGELAIDKNTGLPRVDVSGSPGFCEIIDESTSVDAEQALDLLDLDSLVRFSLRGVRNAFEAGEQNEDNGLRVTLHLKSVETLVCTNRDGGEIEVLDLTTTPPTPITLDSLESWKLRDRLARIVF